MHVDDLASAIYFILKAKVLKNKKLINFLKKTSLINVGSGNELTIKQFAKKICKIEKIKVSFFLTKITLMVLWRKILDNKIMKNLGWSPKISLESGLSNTIKWYKKNYL